MMVCFPQKHIPVTMPDSGRQGGQWPVSLSATPLYLGDSFWETEVGGTWRKNRAHLWPLQLGVGAWGERGSLLNALITEMSIANI